MSFRSTGLPACLHDHSGCPVKKRRTYSLKELPCQASCESASASISMNESPSMVQSCDSRRSCHARCHSSSRSTFKVTFGGEEGKVEDIKRWLEQGMAAMAAGQIDLEASFHNVDPLSAYVCHQRRSPPCHPAPILQSITVEQEGTTVTLDIYPDSHTLKIHSHAPEEVDDGRDADERLIGYIKPYRITVDVFKKRKMEMTVLPDECVKSFRARVLQLLTLPRSIQSAMMLLCNGVCMDDPYKKVKDYSIQRGSYIQCVWRFYRVPPKRNPGILPCRELETHLFRCKRLPGRLSQSWNENVEAAFDCKTAKTIPHRTACYAASRCPAA